MTASTMSTVVQEKPTERYSVYWYDRETENYKLAQTDLDEHDADMKVNLHLRAGFSSYKVAIPTP